MELIPTYDWKYYICKTDYKRKNTCQAVWNRPELDDYPQDLTKLNNLEKAIICKRIVFQKVFIMPKGQMPKINVAQINKILPASADSNGIIAVKLS